MACWRCKCPGGVRATSLEVDLPVEIELKALGDTHEFRCELPRFVTRTSFDRAPDRLLVRWAEGPSERWAEGPSERWAEGLSEGWAEGLSEGWAEGDVP
mgnify:CR=1 FL=1